MCDNERNLQTKRRDAGVNWTGLCALRRAAEKQDVRTRRPAAASLMTET